MTVGKQRRGVAHHSNKLTEAQVVDIRARYGAGETLHALSLAFPSVSKPNLHHIIHFNSWRHLPSVVALRHA